MNEEKLKSEDPIESFSEPNFDELLCGIDGKLVIKFFHYFSRFEHALKMCGYKKIDRDGYLIGVDWREYNPNISYPNEFESINCAVKNLCTFPVKRQKNDFHWEAKPPIDPESFVMALRQVPCIRNNLFHGGKYLRPTPDRDNALIQDAITLIKACLIFDEQLSTQFFSTGK